MAAAIKVVLMREMGIQPERQFRSYKSAHAIIGSNRYSASRDMWNRLLRAMDAADVQVAYYKNVFGHVGEISFLRDRLAHQYTYQATPEYKGFWLNTDIISIREAAKENPIVFPVSAIRKAVSDLALARDCFDGCHEHHVFSADRRIPYNVEPPPWQYKPSMLVRGDQSVENLLSGKSPPPQSWSE